MNFCCQLKFKAGTWYILYRVFTVYIYTVLLYAVNKMK